MKNGKIKKIALFNPAIYNYLFNDSSVENYYYKNEPFIAAKVFFYDNKEFNLVEYIMIDDDYIDWCNDHGIANKSDSTSIQSYIDSLDETIIEQLWNKNLFSGRLSILLLPLLFITDNKVANRELPLNKEFSNYFREFLKNNKKVNDDDIYISDTIYSPEFIKNNKHYIEHSMLNYFYNSNIKTVQNIVTDITTSNVNIKYTLFSINEPLKHVFNRKQVDSFFKTEVDVEFKEDNWTALNEELKHYYPDVDLSILTNHSIRLSDFSEFNSEVSDIFCGQSN